MEYRLLCGDLKVSEISFGCGPNAGLMVRGTLAERCAVVERGLALGVNLFDTASAYGSGQSELNLGATLRELAAQPYIASKVLLQAQDLDQIARAVTKSVESSLKRLGVECLDLVQLHNRVASDRRSPAQIVGIGPMLTLDEVFGSGGVLETLKLLRQQGKVRYFGFTAFGGEVAAINHLIDSREFHTLNACYNLLNPTAAYALPGTRVEPDYGQVLGRAAQAGMGVLVIRVLAGGMLAGSVQRHALARRPDGDDPGYQADVQRVQAFEFLVREGQNLAQAATRFALSTSGVTTIVGGFSAPEHLEEAVACAGSRLDTDTMNRLEAIFRS